jgi:SHS2 domain-containing protein
VAGEYEILEHTADIGILVRGGTLEELFDHATMGLADIAGVWQPNSGDPVDISVEAADLGALLVDWLSEVLFLQDSRGAGIASVRVDRVGDGQAVGSVGLAPLVDPEEGVQVKAITYHQLSVQSSEEGWAARVFFDI